MQIASRYRNWYLAFSVGTRISRFPTLSTGASPLHSQCRGSAIESDIRKLIFGEGFRLIAGGVLVGAALAMVLSRVLKSFLFEVQPSDPATLIVVGALFVGVGLLACWMPVRRAAKVDPLEALRYE